jgi:hypothetical protein
VKHTVANVSVIINTNFFINLAMPTNRVVGRIFEACVVS